MAIDVTTTVAALERLTVGELRQRYLEVFGEPTRSNNRRHLIKRIVWRMQAIEEGDLSERARHRARELANDADLRLRPPAGWPASDADADSYSMRFRPDDGLPAPGTLLRREYKGRVILVRVLERGFEYEGRLYRSLTAIAQEVTGSHWNGRHFFGLHKDAKAESNE